MKKIECVVSRSVRVNLGDYQATEFFVSMKGELEPDDDPRISARRLRYLVDSALIEDIGRHFKARRKVLSREDICKRFGFINKES